MYRPIVMMRISFARDRSLGMTLLADDRKEKRLQFWSIDIVSQEQCLSIRSQVLLTLSHSSKFLPGNWRGLVYRGDKNKISKLREKIYLRRKYESQKDKASQSWVRACACAHTLTQTHTHKRRTYTSISTWCEISYMHRNRTGNYSTPIMC